MNGKTKICAILMNPNATRVEQCSFTDNDDEAETVTQRRPAKPQEMPLQARDEVRTGSGR